MASFISKCWFFLIVCGLTSFLSKTPVFAEQAYYPLGVPFGIPEPLKNVEVIFKAPSAGAESGLYQYEYLLRNNGPADQQLNRFIVDLSWKPRDAVLPVPKEPEDACEIWRNPNVRKNILASPIVPVLLYGPGGTHKDRYGTAIANWWCTVDVKARAWWTAARTEIPVENSKDMFRVENFRIQSGETQTGFRIVSPGLPGIRQFHVEQPADIGEEDLPDDLGGLGLGEYLHKVHYEFNFHGFIVGPVAPPAEFNANKFIKYMESIIDKAIVIEWVNKEDKLIETFHKRFREIEKLIGKKKAKMVSQELLELINLAKSGYCLEKAICSKELSMPEQLFFILAHNIEYLTGRLAEDGL